MLGYIGTHLTEDLSLEALEKRFSVSRRHIQRRFKAATGLTVHEYIIRMKLERCKPYILQGLPISQVYRLTGFGGYNHFFRAFRKEFGMPPKEYYRQAAEKT
nr:AraC family transcriptional regulator [Gemmiger formicilis]